MILGTRSNRISMAMANEVLKRMRERFPGEPVELKIQTGEGKPSEAASGNQTTWEYGQLLEGLRSGGIDAAAVGVDEVPLGPDHWSDVAAVLPRGPAEDVLVSTLPLERLRPGAVIGVSSARQKGLVMNLRPDLVTKNMREGANQGLDIGKGLDGFIVSRAGKELLRIDCPAYTLDPDQFIPGPGQGAVAILCRRDSPHWNQLNSFDDRAARVCVESERFLLGTIAKDNSVPAGIWAVAGEEDIRIRATVSDQDGSTSFRLDRNIGMDRLEEGLQQFAKELKYAWELVI